MDNARQPRLVTGPPKKSPHAMDFGKDVAAATRTGPSHAQHCPRRCGSKEVQGSINGRSGRVLVVDEAA